MISKVLRLCFINAFKAYTTPHCLAHYGYSNVNKKLEMQPVAKDKD